MTSDDKAGRDTPVAPVLKGNNVSASSNNGVVTITIDGKPLDLAALAPPAPAPPRPNLRWLRAERAAVLLEEIGTPEARRLLQALADGEPDAPPTREAKAALERMAKVK